MKQPRLAHSRKLLRNALVCALTLATVFVFTVLATPVSALSEGEREERAFGGLETFLEEGF